MSTQKRDEEDGLFDDATDDSSVVEEPAKKRTKSTRDDESSSEEEEEAAKKPAKKRRKIKEGKFIDDAAEESGSENDSDEEEEDEGEDDYVKDDFVVDEEEPVQREKKGDLEDSDDEEEGHEDDEDEDEGSDDARERRRLKKVRKMKATDRLDEEDLALIQEAQGGDELPPAPEEEEKPRETVVAKSEAELRKGLFYDSGDEDEQQKEIAQKKARRVERYDEDGLDDFIEDDIGDQDDIRRSGRDSGVYDDNDEGRREVSEAQLQEASEIFGTDYLEFMQEEEEPDEEEEELLGKERFRERGVGVQYGMDSDEEILSDESEEDDDLFRDEDEDEVMDGSTAQQKAEALRLKREKRNLAKKERRQQALKKKEAQKKARLRRNFEPALLAENFCTDRDDEIRQTDKPERFFDWKTPFRGSDQKDSLSDEDVAEAKWIANRIPAIASELAAAGDSEEAQKEILCSIANALRFMHKEKLEPEFIKRYRKDYVPSEAVREHLYSVKDEDGEYDRLLTAQSKVATLLETITSAANADENVGADAQKLTELQNELQEAQEKLDDTAKQESLVKGELEALGGAENDDDDELFGDDDEEEEKKKEKTTRLSSHLETLQSLLEARADKVSQLQSQIDVVEAQNKALNDSGPVERIQKKMCRSSLWNLGDYSLCLSTLTDIRQVLDMNSYLNLVKEGNDAIRKKEMPMWELTDGGSDKRKRSRRFDRDYYRTCVSEGLRAVCYRFLLSPIRVGIKLEDNLKLGGFDFTKTMAGEENEEGSGDPLRWVAPTIVNATPSEFANDLIGSGELVLLSSVGGGHAEANEAKDPLLGCRHVAALELASEPRVRRCMRDIFRKNAVLTTKPTQKGLREIDYFHDVYGLHLIRGKPLKDHFPPDQDEVAARKKALSPKDCAVAHEEDEKRQRQSCVQYLNILKAEKWGLVTVHIHLPLNETYGDEWYKADTGQLMHRENQNTSSLMNELERVYMPPDGDTDEWNEERQKVLRSALKNFLLPQFESEARRELREVAVKVGAVVAGESLREMAMEGPYRPVSIVHKVSRFVHPTGNLSIVGVCCSRDPKDATWLAFVDANGEAKETLAIPFGMNDWNKGKMGEEVITFLMKTRPEAVVVGTSGHRESRIFHRNIGELLRRAVDRWEQRDIQGDEDDEDFEARQEEFRRQFQKRGYFDDDEEEPWKCNVELVDDSVSQLFGRSIRGKKEFPDYSTNLRSAISVARHAKDPLAELTYAWTVVSDAGMFGTELLFLNIHAIQRQVPQALLLREYERVLCGVVADVGVDLNACCGFDHLRGLLAFVPGLGPRKAAHLKQTVTKIGGAIARRRDILEQDYLGPIVYNNAVAFLRISDSEKLHDQLIHPLDQTRLHPDVYQRNNWAAKIAFDALEREGQDSKDSTVMKAIRDVMDNSEQEIERLFHATKAEWEKQYGPTFTVKLWNPRSDVPANLWKDKIEELDLDTFGNMLEQQGSGRWHSHLEMIKWEYRLPFADPRDPMQPLLGDKLFRLITGETDQTLRPGKEVTGRVIENQNFGSRVMLEGGIRAFIPLQNLSDDRVDAADDFVQVGQVVWAVVKEVKKDHIDVDLSLKMEDLRRDPSSWKRPDSMPPLDVHFDRSASRRIEESNAKNREARIEAMQIGSGTKNREGGGGAKRKKGFVNRACNHPAFRNEKFEAVHRELKEGGASMVGEALIHPSSSSSDFLGVSWMYKEGSIKVIQVKEEGKNNPASIGKVLKIKDAEYGSIDELLGRHIAPMNEFVEKLVSHRKFVDTSEEELDESLKRQKIANPSLVVYAICWSETYPARASLRYIRTENPREQLIGITPEGFTWSGKNFEDLEVLTNAFKANPSGIPSSKSPTREASPIPQERQATAAATSRGQGRWGAKQAPVVPPTARSTTAVGWVPLPPPVQPAAPAIPVAAQASGWGDPPSAPTRGWLPPPPQQQAFPPQQQAFPPQHQPPPPSAPRRPPLPPGPPPANLPLPPPAAAGRGPLPPPQGFQQPQQQQPPAFAAAPGGAAQGRGRGRTLPAWMSRG